MKALKIIIPVILAGVLVVGGVSLVKKRQAADNKESKAIIYPVVVKSYTAKEKNVTLTMPYLAEVKNDKDIVINSKFSGKVLYIANLGKKVKKGDILVKIDNTDLKTKLKEVNFQINSLKNKLNAEKINLNNLIITHKRTKKLLDVKMASIEEYQNEESKIATLQASIKADKNSIESLRANKNSILNNMQYTIIKSPIDAIVSNKFVNKGDNTFMAKPILKLSSSNGNYLFITLPTYKKEIVYKNQFYKLIALNNSTNGLLSFKAKVKDQSLINGEKVNVNIVEFSGDAKTYPYEAVLSINNQNFVFDTNANIHQVKIVAKGQNRVVLDNAPDNVIVANPDILLKIKAGYPIKVENSNAN